jgi:transcriptional regulator with XRE-family HTH domain
MVTSYRIESGIDTIKRQQVLASLENREYRREFAADVGTGLAFQIRLLREARGWTQEQLAQKMGKRQETICQWENPNYGRYTLKTLGELAAAFDVALLVRFAPFGELVEWSISLTPERLAPPCFDDELQSMPRVPQDLTTLDFSSEPALRRGSTLWAAGVPSDGDPIPERLPAGKEKETQYAAACSA